MRVDTSVRYLVSSRQTAMSADFPLRPATADDVPALVALVNSAYRGDSSRQPTWVNGRSLYGYATERTFPAAGNPIEAVFVDP